MNNFGSVLSAAATVLFILQGCVEPHPDRNLGEVRDVEMVKRDGFDHVRVHTKNQAITLENGAGVGMFFQGDTLWIARHNTKAYACNSSDPKAASSYRQVCPLVIEVKQTDSEGVVSIEK